MEIPTEYSETGLRLGVFAGLLVLFSVWEVVCARRKVRRSWRVRAYNLCLIAVGAVLLRMLAFSAQLGSATGAAVWAESCGFGIFYTLALPWWAGVIVGIAGLDLLIYGQHWAFHKAPILWRIHRVHHSDREVDATTALRFHPAEMLFSMLIKAVFIALVGIPVEAAVIFEVILNGMAMFNHANIRLPTRLEPHLRAVLVTPDMHRVHHSILEREHNRNFGFNLSVWDRAFGTYHAEPAGGHEGMKLGLGGLQGADLSLAGMLGLPFVTGNKSERSKVKAG